MTEASFSGQLDETQRQIERMNLTNLRSRRIVALGEAAFALWKAGTPLPDGLVGILRELMAVEARLAEIAPAPAEAPEAEGPVAVPVLEGVPSAETAEPVRTERPELEAPAAPVPQMPDTPVPTMTSVPRRVGVPTDHPIGAQPVPSMLQEVEASTAAEARRAVSAAVDQVREGAAAAGKKVYQSIDEILGEMLKSK